MEFGCPHWRCPAPSRLLWHHTFCCLLSVFLLCSNSHKLRCRGSGTLCSLVQKCQCVFIASGTEVWVLTQHNSYGLDNLRNTVWLLGGTDFLLHYHQTFSSSPQHELTWHNTSISDGPKRMPCVSTCGHVHTAVYFDLMTS
jgi:hypothetical protein